MLTPSTNRVKSENLTPFKALKEFSKSGLNATPQDSLLTGENIHVNLEYSTALKELQILKNEIKNHKKREEELEKEISNLENYNSRVEMMELNLKGLQVKVSEYKSLVKVWEKWMVGVVVVFLAIVIMLIRYV